MQMLIIIVLHIIIIIMSHLIRLSHNQTPRRQTMETAITRL